MAQGLFCGIEDLLASGSQLVWTLTEQVLRRCYSDGLVPCRRFLQTCCHLGDVYQMTEGRLCQVLLLDDRQLELLVQPKLLSRDLLDLVSSHFNLKEKEYFGISFTDERGQKNWLQLDRRVLDHDFSKKTGPLELKFQVRFYIESVACLKDATTVKLFFRNAKISVYNETIEVESEIVFKLAAYTVQEANGDFISDESTRSDLKKLPAFPTAVLKEHPSLAFCEDKVIEHYKKLKGLSRGQAIVRYMTLVESLPAYGVHYYKVKDKQGIPWWLGISYKGIGQYDLQDKLKPRKLFLWKQLENLYFREKKFAVEVNDPQRRTASRRTFGQSGQVIHTWYASHSLIKTIWVMAISQHQFYLDRKQSKAKITTARSLGDIAMDLSETGAPRNSKLVSMESKDKLIMASNGSLVSSNSADNDVNEEQKKEKIAELKNKQKSLNEILALKEEELKRICLREAELTGVLPKEYPLASGEKPPTVRRRMGTAFKLDDLFPYDADPLLRNMEGCFALQKKIVEAAKKLAYENELCKTVKKKRRRNLLDATKKLQEIENEINGYRVKIGKEPTQRASVIIADDVNLDSLSDCLNLEDDEPSQRQRSRSVQYSPRPNSSNSFTASYNSEHGSDDHQNYSRLNYGEVQEPVTYIQGDTLSTHSPYHQPSRQPSDSRSMPPTPQLPRNAYSSIQLSTHYRQRSGSLESQSQFLTESEPSEPVFTISSPRRSNSTEILDDGSSYTSQSSVEYSAPGCHSRAKNRHRRRQGNIYANTGSMPNLAQNDTRGYTSQPRQQPTTTAYYVTGYPRYMEPEVYPNGPYMYETEMEGHYNVNPSYPRHDPHGNYGHDEIDGLAHNLYATLRPPRNRPPSRNENFARSMQRAEVVEHLRGWYSRQNKQPGYDTYRGPQQNLGYRTMSSSYVRSDSTASYSTVSSGNWHSRPVMAMSDYEMPLTHHHPYGYNTVHHSHQLHSRSYIDVSHHDSHTSSPIDSSFDSEDQQTLHWHEDSKPGTIV
ncbi:FERM domain-containing protein 4B isoform X3 [Rhinichthys klamathensis goyatoka]|uniref:FERM domain-containing protein 4B isoform X3 n=1 Tax=Rhinichthys klamathensis goyatoka TaxID=3034132 RepID=UPI0024B5C42C|nr:FERM domain-containing protein 4B isoform X3 [Rhinichthys klamathensis goyatoka]